MKGGNTNKATIDSLPFDSKHSAIRDMQDVRVCSDRVWIDPGAGEAG